MQSALKDIFGPMFETVLKGELNHHLVYDSNDEGEKPSPNRRCGNDKKTLHTSAGERKLPHLVIEMDHLNLNLFPSVKKDVSAIENKVISMYEEGMLQRTIEEIYGFKVSHDMISEITDTVMLELEEWQTRLLSNCYAFVFVDCMFTTIRNEYKTKNMPYTIF